MKLLNFVSARLKLQWRDEQERFGSTTVRILEQHVG